MIRALLTFFVCFLLAGTASASPVEPINAEIGDESWIAAHGVTPTANSDDLRRIRTHLRFVIERLRRSDTSHLSDSRRARRAAALRHLSAYADAGIFPRREPDDGYGERRPRFIDDRNVHCAVGELIRYSGYATLAAQINSDWEYAYVREIESPELTAWADEHGFSVRELAMIQPSYREPITPKTVETELRARVPTATVQCLLKKHAFVPKLEVKATWDGTKAEVALTSEPSPFTTCVANWLGENFAWLMRGSKEDPFHKQLKVTVPTLAQIAEEQLEAVPVDNCAGQPGSVPKQVTIRVKSGSGKFDVHASTNPANTRIAACVQRIALGQFRAPMSGLSPLGSGDFEFDVRVARKMSPRVSEEVLKRGAEMAGFNARGQCRDGSPEKVTVRVVSRLNANALEIEVKNGPPEFRKCVERVFKETLHPGYTTQVRQPDGSFEPQVHLDADAEVTTTFERYR